MNIFINVQMLAAKLILTVIAKKKEKPFGAVS